MDYKTVFDISKQPFEWWWPAIGLLIIGAGIVSIKFISKWPNQKNAKIAGWVMVVFGLFFTILVYNSVTSDWRDYRSVYARGAYSTVEGLVYNFKPMPYEGHSSECFWVQSEQFCYSDYVLQPGFRQSASHGGPIREGLPVRIAYYQGQILRLEVRADSLTPEAARAEYAKTEEAESQQRLLSQPQVDHMLLGISFLSVVISLLFNLDWKHCIRYWLRREPPYSSLVEFGFRGFFLLSFAGSVIHLFRFLNAKHRTTDDFEKAAIFSLILIAIFAVFDLIARWRLRTKNQPPNPRPRPASGSSASP
jgi:hypothetical protein